ncbi:phage baseplate plug family protein [Entomohabitans teleogrylli]|uniref:phage baseplate plug family protein n=1 Tax=Entomohabitans teleogrylli TaxID=1384589 RepID=UPI00073D77AA|nr:hypothetical protein [Entomohabitans teleogrylli]
METTIESVISIKLEALPNQSFTIRLADNRYQIRIICISDNLMAATIVRDNVTLIQNMRIVAGIPLLPSHHARGFGNFIFITPDETYPYYTEFNNGHEFYFIPEA